MSCFFFSNIFEDLTNNEIIATDFPLVSQVSKRVQKEQNRSEID